MGTFSHAPELLILLAIALVIFGPKKLPDLGKGLGEGLKEFRKATTGESKEPDVAPPAQPAPASPPAAAETMESPAAESAAAKPQ